MQLAVARLAERGQFPVKALSPVRQALEELRALQQSWRAELRTASAAMLTQQCYRFLAALGLVYRSCLGLEADSLLPERSASPMRRRVTASRGAATVWKKLALEFAEVLSWARNLFQAHGLAIAARAVSSVSLQSWPERAKILADQAEYTDAANQCDGAEVAAQSVALLRELDDAELVHALASLALEFLTPPSARVKSQGSALADAGLIDRLPANLKALSAAIRSCGEWLEDHQEAFLPAAEWIVNVTAGLRQDLDDYADLAVTAWKFSDLVDMISVAEGVAEPFGNRQWLEKAVQQCVATADVGGSAGELTIPPVSPGVAAEIPTGRLYVQTQKLGQVLAYPRQLLMPLLAAASGEQTPTGPVLRWRSPDGQYEAALVLAAPRSSQWVLRFYTTAGQRANQLVGEPYCLGGCAGRIGPEAVVKFDRNSLERCREDLYLEVGKPPQRWIPAAPTQVSQQADATP